jgi:hypothetical protein
LIHQLSKGSISLDDEIKTTACRRGRLKPTGDTDRKDREGQDIEDQLSSTRGYFVKREM